MALLQVIASNNLERAYLISQRCTIHVTESVHQLVGIFVGSLEGSLASLNSLPLRLLHCCCCITAIALLLRHCCCCITVA